MYRGKVTTNPSEYLDEITEFCKIAYNESGDKNFELKSDGTSSLLRHITENSIPMITMVLEDKKIISPCVKICKYDNKFMDGMVCIGCFREQYEITNWLRLSPDEKRQALFDIEERKTKFKIYDK